MTFENEKALLHYYVDPMFNPLSIVRERLATEIIRIPNEGDIVIIDPYMMENQSTKLLPGAYKVLEIRPNKKYPEQTFGYRYHNTFFEIVPLPMALVEPLYTTKKFNRKLFFLEDSFDENTGEVIKIINVADNDTGEIITLKC